MTIFRNDADRYRPSVQRRDRRWEVHAGNRRFAIVFSDHRAYAPVASFQVLRRVGESRRPSGGSVSKAIGAVLAVIGGVALSGGRGTLPGALAGAAILVTVFNAVLLFGLPVQFQIIIQGLVIIVATAFYARQAA